MMKEFKKLLWAVVSPKGNVFVETIRYTRKDSITYFLEGSSMTWNQAKKAGWKCMKADVHVMPASWEKLWGN